MKSLKTYIPGLILSILLVFSLLGCSAAFVANSFSDPDRLIRIADENEIVTVIKNRLDSYFSGKYNETGIPADVYTEAVGREYIKNTMRGYVYSGFDVLNGNTADFSVPENKELEENIEAFIGDYADSIGFTKDEKYEEKVQATIRSAYRTIGEYCDVFKMETLEREGILAGLSPVFTRINLIFLVSAAVSAALIAVIIIISIKNLFHSLYWIGISSLVSGIIGIVPCICLTATRYFDSFTIKEPQIYTSFTSLMYSIVNQFMLNQIVIAVIGALLIIRFAVVCKNKKDKASE